MSKLLCLVCKTEEAVPKVGHGTGIPNKQGTQLLCPEGDSQVHASVPIPLHCGRPMRYFEDEDADQYRVCPD